MAVLVISLKPIEAEQSCALWSLYVEAMKSYVERIWGWDEAWQRQDFESGFQRYVSKGIDCDGEFAGYVQFRDEGTARYISMLLLAEPYRSKGVGAVVLNQLRGDRALRLNCFRINERALRFYLKLGFSEVGRDEQFHRLYRPAEIQRYQPATRKVSE